MLGITCIYVILANDTDFIYAHYLFYFLYTFKFWYMNIYSISLFISFFFKKHIPIRNVLKYY